MIICNFHEKVIGYPEYEQRLRGFEKRIPVDDTFLAKVRLTAKKIPIGFFFAALEALKS